MEATKIPDAELQTMVLRMLKDLSGRMDYLNENINKVLVSIKNNIEP